MISMDGRVLQSECHGLPHGVAKLILGDCGNLSKPVHGSNPIMGTLYQNHVPVIILYTLFLLLCPAAPKAGLVQVATPQGCWEGTRHKVGGDGWIGSLDGSNPPRWVPVFRILYINFGSGRVKPSFIKL